MELIIMLCFIIPYITMTSIVGYLIYKIEKLEEKKCPEEK
jgi:uncharacterized membrane protein